MKNTIIVDLASLTYDEQADWLRYNQKLIDFDKSYEFIEETHAVRHNGDITHLSTLPDYVSVKIYDFKKLLFPENHSYKYDFETCGYERYANLSISNNTLHAKLGDFDEDESTYSIPFLRSIIYNNGLDESADELHFKLATLPSNNKESVIIKLYLPDNSAKYYDYSQQPSK